MRREIDNGPQSAPGALMPFDMRRGEVNRIGIISVDVPSLTHGVGWLEHQRGAPSEVSRSPGPIFVAIWALWRPLKNP